MKPLTTLLILFLFSLKASCAAAPAAPAAGTAPQESETQKVAKITGRTQSKISALVFAAQLHESKSEYKAALDAYEKIWNIYKADPGLGPESARAAWAKAKISLLESRLLKKADAEKNAQEALRIVQGLSPDWDINEANYLVMAREILKAVLGKNMPAPGKTPLRDPILKPFVVCDLEDIKQSEKLLQELLAESEKNKDFTSQKYCKRAIFLANIYTIQKKYTLAAPLFKKAIPAIEKRAGKNSIELSQAISNYGYMLKQQGNEAQAQEQLKRLIQIFRVHT